MLVLQQKVQADELESIEEESCKCGAGKLRELARVDESASLSENIQNKRSAFPCLHDRYVI